MDRSLYAASCRGDARAVEALLRDGECPWREEEQHRRRTPLHAAASAGAAPVCELLLAHGASVDARDCGGSTPLMLAAHAGHDAVVRLLLAAGARPNEATARGFTGLHLTLCADRASTCRLLLSAGADREATAMGGFTPLMAACISRRPELVELLLRAGARVDVANENGQSPLHVAVVQECAATCLVLLRHGASAVARNSRGETPVEVAALEGGETAALLSAWAEGEHPLQAERVALLGALERALLPDLASLCAAYAVLEPVHERGRLAACCGGCPGSGADGPCRRNCTRRKRRCRSPA